MRRTVLFVMVALSTQPSCYQPDLTDTRCGDKSDCPEGMRCNHVRDRCELVFDASLGPRLTVTKAGAGHVESSPAGIDCGESCTAQFPLNARVTLTATSQGAAVFRGWINDCNRDECELLMTVDREVGANFSCDPLYDDGCLPTEKCTWYIYTSYSSSTSCQPEGTQAAGEHCITGEQVPDPCKDGLVCYENQCHEVCVDGSCDTGSCVVHDDLFTDVPEVGVCE